MAESITLVAKKRDSRGKLEARRMRRGGMVPGVVYGHKEETVAIMLPEAELEHAIRHNVHVLDLQTEGKVEKALIREVQWDHLGKSVLHVDFARIAADERIVVTVPIEIKGTAIGIAAGGVLDQPIHSLAIECLATQIPDSIRVNVTELQLGSAIHVKELTLPPGVKAMVDADAVVVHVTMKHVEPEAPAAPAAAVETAEPEVIGRQKEEEEEETAE
jgi:large subunit ribosomal protein L25